MRPGSGVFLLAFLNALAIMAGLDAAFAQARSGGCTIAQVGGTGRQVVQCSSGLSVTVESGARFTMLDRNRDGNADTVRLSRGAVLLDVERPVERIEVIAPQAIASVRGTNWAVDAQATRTSVFVVRGTVDVRRRSGAARVSLHAGDGVDVDAGAGPLTVKRWPAARVAALLARFGQ
ncbi:FecR domain-containing protein [Mesorhizobium sp. BAC0120]|uniref:FecR domain-containing protein n=1 Tax=Mesorhizobium sp. BAC0120 TaxID=3090670 RepID=UPI00298CE5E4|nr:FecR domain-containing protein [Mesorhizobium sp. BAC0120]MDW6021377.1 FecR domain-containing protein [Mesorhizobium sp. BAC0120]